MREVRAMTEQASPAAGAERCEEHGGPRSGCGPCAEAEAGRVAYWRELETGAGLLLNATATAQDAVREVGRRFREVRQDNDEIGAQAEADAAFEIEQAMRSLRHVQRIAGEHAACIDRELRGEAGRG
jgi:hypothetical protein